MQPTKPAATAGSEELRPEYGTGDAVDPGAWGAANAAASMGFNNMPSAAREEHEHASGEKGAPLMRRAAVPGPARLPATRLQTSGH